MLECVIREDNVLMNCGWWRLLEIYVWIVWWGWAKVGSEVEIGQEGKSKKTRRKRSGTALNRVYMWYRCCMSEMERDGGG